MNLHEATPPVAKGDATGRTSANTGVQFGTYLLADKLGHGGMAEVFLAVQRGKRGFHKVCALKRLHTHLERDPDAVSMFEREANLAARLQHPQIVQTLEVGDHEGRHFMAMEYLDGQTLSQLLRALRERGERLRPDLAARVISDALEGLHHAHEACDYDGRWLELVHRDVSPHNLFVTRDGHVKVLDFGIAKVSLGDEHTRCGLIKGKLSYIAPEQARGEVVDRRADLWSTGVTLWEMLAGRRLFQGASDVDTLRAALLDPVPALRDVAPHVPDELAAIVARAVTRAPEMRFESALSFKLALEEWLASHSITTTRAELARLLRELFGDAATRRQEALRSCIAEINGETGALPALAPGPFASEARHSLFDFRPAGHPLAKRLTVLALAITCGGVAALVQHRARHAEPAPTKPAAAIVATHEQRVAAPLSVKTATPAVAQVSPAPVEEPTLAPARRRVARRRATEEAISSEPVPASPIAPSAEPQSTTPDGERHGRLRLDSAPYAIVDEQGTRLGITPLDVRLPVGRHTLTLRNPEHGLETTYLVTIDEQGVTERRVALD